MAILHVKVSPSGTPRPTSSELDFVVSVTSSTDQLVTGLTDANFSFTVKPDPVVSGMFNSGNILLHAVERVLPTLGGKQPGSPVHSGTYDVKLIIMDLGKNATSSFATGKKVSFDFQVHRNRAAGGLVADSGQASILYTIPPEHT